MFVSQIYIFEMHTAPKACLLYAPEAVFFLTMESWSIFNFAFPRRLIMVQGHEVLMVWDHDPGP